MLTRPRHNPYVIAGLPMTDDTANKATDTMSILINVFLRDMLFYDANLQIIMN